MYNAWTEITYDSETNPNLKLKIEELILRKMKRAEPGTLFFLNNSGLELTFPTLSFYGQTFDPTISYNGGNMKLSCLKG